MNNKHQGIRYKTANDQLNQQAVELIQQILAQNPSLNDDLTAGMLIIGPGLWQRIQADMKNHHYEIIPSEFRVPNLTNGKTQVLKAAIFKNCQPIKTIIQLIMKHSVSKKFTVRKLSPSELQIHWSLISWDIEEPIFIAEVEEMHLLFSFRSSQGKLSIFLLDDMAQYRTGQ